MYFDCTAMHRTNTTTCDRVLYRTDNNDRFEERREYMAQNAASQREIESFEQSKI